MERYGPIAVHIMIHEKWQLVACTLRHADSVLVEEACCPSDKRSSPRKLSSRERKVQWKRGESWMEIRLQS